MDDMSEDWREAERRIEEVRASGVEVLDLSRLDIEAVPASVAGLEQVREVQLEYCANLVDLTALKQLPALQLLSLNDRNVLSSLSQLASLPGLQSLSLKGYNVLSNLSPLASLPALRSLSFYDCQVLSDLSPLASLPALQSLSLSGYDVVSNRSQLVPLPALQSLSLNDGEVLSSLPPQASLPVLQSLTLKGYDALSDLSLLASLPALQSLSFYDCQVLSDLSPLASLPALQSLSFNRCHTLSKLLLLTSLPALQSLHLTSCYTLSDLSLPVSQPALQSLHLSHCPVLSDLSLPVEQPSLQSLHLSGCPVLSNLSMLAPQPALQFLDFSFGQALNKLLLPVSLPALQSLDLSHCYALSDLSLPASLPVLQSLDLSHCTLSDLSLPVEQPALQSLDLSGCHALSKLSLPVSLPALQSLDLSGCHALSKLSLPVSLPALQSLDLSGCHALSKLSLPVSLPALQSLDLSGCHALNDLSQLPSLPALQSLHLSNYHVSDLSLLSSLPTLQSLDLSGCHALNDLLQLPLLPGLQSLHLSKCHALKYLWLQSLVLCECEALSTLSLPVAQPALQSLDLSGCHVLNKLSLPVSQPALQSLDLRNCYALSDLSLPVAQPALQSLDLSSCGTLSTLSLPVAQPALKSLDLHNCHALSTLSLPVAQPALKSLDLHNCHALSTLSLPVAQPALQSLNLSSCHTLSTLSLPIAQPALKSLDLSYSHALSTLSLPVAQPALQSLDLSYSHALSTLSLPAAQPALQSLNLSHCHTLSTLSLPVAQPVLQSLDLCECEALSTLSLPVAQPALQSLDLRYCHALSTLSLPVSQPALQSLDLSGCHALSDLSQLVKLPALKKLYLPDSIALPCQPGSSILDTAIGLETLHCDSLLIAPNELASQEDIFYRDNCLPRLKAWRTDLDQGQAGNHRTKIFLIGNGSAGKTQICRRLHGQAFDPSIPSTHGIDLGLLSLIPASENSPTVMAHVWDFGGQDIYHGTHALFMDERALFVIVWNPELETAQPYAEHGVAMRHRPLAYWLAMVRDVAGEDAAVVVVQSKCDQLQDSVPPPLPVNHGLRHLRYTECSARQVDGLDSVLAEIRRQARLLLERYGQVLLPASWVAVGDTLRTLRSEHEQRTLPRAEFEALCRASHASAPPEVVLRYLHRSGEVFYRPGLFGDQLVLDQQWALNGVYAVLDRQRSVPLLRRQGGVFDRDMLDALVWRDEYSQDEQALFISLMEQCGACFRLKKNWEQTRPVRYLAPDLLPERGEVQVQIDRVWRSAETHLEVWLDYRFLHDGVMKDLLCQIGQRAGVHAVYWRYGVCFFDQGMQATFWLEAQPDINPDQPGAGRLVWRAHVAQAENRARVQRWLEGLLKTIQRKAQGQPPVVTWRHQQVQRSKQDEESDQDPIQRLQPGNRPDDKPTVYVSYGWSEANTALLGQLEAGFTQRGCQLIYDKKKTRTGDWISTFMREIGQSRHVLVVLDDKYLHSPYCMRELLYLYQSSLGDKAEFCRRIVPCRPESLPLSSVKHRLPYLRHWKEEAKSHQELLDEFSLAELSPETRDEVLLVKDFCHRTDEMLAWIADTLMPRGTHALYDNNFAAIFNALAANGFPVPHPDSGSPG